MKYCPGCNKKLGDEYSFCDFCGTPLKIEVEKACSPVSVSLYNSYLSGLKEKAKKHVRYVLVPSTDTRDQKGKKIKFIGIILILFIIFEIFFLLCSDLDRSKIELNKTRELLNNRVEELGQTRTILAVKESELEQTKSILQNTKETLSKREQDIVSLQNTINSMQSTISLKDNEINSLRNDLSSKSNQISTLQTQLAVEKNSLRQSQNELQGAKTALSTKEQQLKKASDTVANMEYRINNLANWVTANAILPEDILQEIHSTYLDPLSGDSIDSCSMGASMTNRMGFQWTDDKKMSGKVDHLFDVRSFWNSRKGDCDDFAFFMSAWLRSEIRRVKSYGREASVRLGTRSCYYDFRTFSYQCGCSTTIFKPSAQEKDIYMVCGILKSGGGHCEVGVSAVAPDDKDFFRNFLIFEPQSGEYRGTFFQEFANGWEAFSDNDFIQVSDDTVVSSRLSVLRTEIQKLKAEI